MGQRAWHACACGTRVRVGPLHAQTALGAQTKPPKHTRNKTWVQLNLLAASLVPSAYIVGYATPLRVIIITYVCLI